MTHMRALRAIAVGAAATALIIAAQKAPAGNVEKGKEVFHEQSCDTCHSTAGPDKSKAGPSLKGLFSKRKLQNGNPATQANVRAKIEAGGNGMPAYKDMLSKQEHTDLMAYLRKL